MEIYDATTFIQVIDTEGRVSNYPKNALSAEAMDLIGNVVKISLYGKPIYLLKDVANTVSAPANAGAADLVSQLSFFFNSQGGGGSIMLSKILQSSEISISHNTWQAYGAIVMAEPAANFGKTSIFGKLVVFTAPTVDTASAEARVYNRMAVSGGGTLDPDSLVTIPTRTIPPFNQTYECFFGDGFAIDASGGLFQLALRRTSPIVSGEHVDLRAAELRLIYS